MNKNLLDLEEKRRFKFRSSKVEWGTQRCTELYMWVVVGHRSEGEDKDRADVWISPALAAWALEKLNALWSLRTANRKWSQDLNLSLWTFSPTLSLTLTLIDGIRCGQECGVLEPGFLGLNSSFSTYDLLLSWAKYLLFVCLSFPIGIHV